MDNVPQKYYDTCEWVRRYYTQSGTSDARKPRHGDSKPSVYTLPSSEPNLNFVLELFPPPVDKTTASRHSSAQPRRADEAESLESRYHRLLLRISDDIAMSDAAE
ncbi:unspecified product [Leishmania tarentolae]|uniref:Unspecified product n=1 Tax=Leishmania tarentolae TaxID=5689 RepID=A0A640KUG3_LEITA|nr:unspecified product [Leishmania tarentolae]